MHSAALEHILRLHAEDAAFLWDTRQGAVRSPAVGLRALSELDERLDANLDGLVLAGELGGALCEAQLQAALGGELFAACIWALRTGATERISDWLATAEEKKADLSPVAAALGWVEQRFSGPTVNSLLASADVTQRLVALRGMDHQGFASSESLARALEDPLPDVRAQALRVLRWADPRAALPILQHALGDREERCRLQAATSAVLLGDRKQAIDVLEDCCATPGPVQEEPLQVLVAASPLSRSRRVLEALMRRPSNRLDVLRAIPLTGDWRHLPWLIEQARDKEVAALAGLSFTALTGAEGAAEVASQPPPNRAGEECAEDEALAEPGEADLPVPDPLALQAWWDAHAKTARHDARFLLGQPLSLQTCEYAWRTATQPFRAVAALHLAVLQPGKPGLDAAAPAWRQKRRNP